MNKQRFSRRVLFTFELPSEDHPEYENHKRLKERLEEVSTNRCGLQSFLMRAALDAIRREQDGYVPRPSSIPAQALQVGSKDNLLPEQERRTGSDSVNSDAQVESVREWGAENEEPEKFGSRSALTDEDIERLQSQAVRVEKVEHKDTRARPLNLNMNNIMA